MKEIVSPLLEWYQENKRSLPWRQDKNPYHVWISEIMLQQTRIEAVKGYYQRFMNALPTIADLSRVNDETLLKLWEGLGYYNRAHNLKKAAIKIMKDYQGIFPEKYEDILSLPGIGKYTAGAISSICFHAKEVAIDGNVMRVYDRLQNKDLNVTDEKEKQKVAEILKKILPENSGDFNEGIMELGETICLPNAMPRCSICPLSNLCLAHRHHTELEIPRKIVKKEKQQEKMTVFLMVCDGKIAIHKRTNGVLKGLWEFPNIEGYIAKKDFPLYISHIIDIRTATTNTHVFTHKVWKMKGYIVRVSQMDQHYLWKSLEEIDENYAIPTAFGPFLNYLRESQK